MSLLKQAARPHSSNVFATPRARKRTRLAPLLSLPPRRRRSPRPRLASSVPTTKPSATPIDARLEATVISSQLALAPPSTVPESRKAEKQNKSTQQSLVGPLLSELQSLGVVRSSCRATARICAPDLGSGLLVRTWRSRLNCSAPHSFFLHSSFEILQLCRHFTPFHSFWSIFISRPCYYSNSR